MWRLSWAANLAWQRMKAWPEWLQVTIIVTLGIVFMVGSMAGYIAIKRAGA